MAGVAVVLSARSRVGSSRGHGVSWWTGFAMPQDTDKIVFLPREADLGLVRSLSGVPAGLDLEACRHTLAPPRFRLPSSGPRQSCRRTRWSPGYARRRPGT